MKCSKCDGLGHHAEALGHNVKCKICNGTGVKPADLSPPPPDGPGGTTGQ